MRKLTNNTIIIQKEPVCIQFKFTESMLLDKAYNVKKEFSRHFDESIYNLLLRGNIPVSKLGKVCATYPRDWIQAFKERWFPKWVLKRYPVIYENNLIEVRAIYKDFKPRCDCSINFKRDITEG